MAKQKAPPPVTEAVTAPEGYTVLARRYRPQLFSELIGQEHVARALENALKSNRVAHAYLFTGARGTGKTSTARILAKALNCERGPTVNPCGTCGLCRSIASGDDVDVLEIDGASNRGIDEVRAIRQNVQYHPQHARFKIYIVDECFRYEELITLADGAKIPIGKIVESGLSVEVLSYNEKTLRLEPKPVVRHFCKKPTLPVVRLTFDNHRALVCTVNHKIYTPQGMRQAGELAIGEFVYANYESITRQQLEVIVGAAVGDGHLSLTGSGMRARLCARHGVAQQDYLTYKANLLGDLVRTPPRYERAPQSFSKEGTYSFRTLSRPQIAEVHRELYDSQGRKRIQRDYLQRLTPLCLALWYLDDGSLLTQDNKYTRKKDGSVAHYLCRRSTFALSACTAEEAQLVCRWLQDRWGIDGGVSLTAKGPVIWLTLPGTHRLHEIIAPYVPPSMAYKLLPAYQHLFSPPVDNGIQGGLAVSIVKRVEQVAPPPFVYNIEVADNHNYFARDILVANCHMLSPPAFNALLKTLEEPPPHVKFIFATTEVQKIPITILSRCQRFDFAGIGVQQIHKRLREIVGSEGRDADDDALEMVARRAGGSMRDAQSLLDQLLAFGGDRLTADQVHGLLGTAGDDRVVELASAVLEHDAKRALDQLAELAGRSLQLGELLDQLMAYWRDLMVVRCAGEQAPDLSVPARHRETLAKQAAVLSLDTILAGLDVLNGARTRLRNTNHGRLLVEMALVRLARLEDLMPLSQLAQWVSQGRIEAGAGPAAAPARLVAPPEGLKKKLAVLPAESHGGNGVSAPAQPLSADTLPHIWPQVLAAVGGFFANSLDKAGFPAISGPNTLAIRFAAVYNADRDYCQEPSRIQRLEQVLQKITGHPWKVRVETGGSAANNTPIPAPVVPSREAGNSLERARRQREEAESVPLIKRALEVLGAEVRRVDDGFNTAPAKAAEGPVAEPPELEEPAAGSEEG